MPCFSLHSVGEGEFGEKSIVEIAADVIQVAQENPTFYKPPAVVFKFMSGISPDVEEELTRAGVMVVDFDTPVQLPEFTSPVLNVDITTMITMASDLSNGFASNRFSEPFLEEQARDEQLQPVMEGLLCLFSLCVDNLLTPLSGACPRN